MNNDFDYAESDTVASSGSGGNFAPLANHFREVPVAKSSINEERFKWRRIARSTKMGKA